MWVLPILCVRNSSILLASSLHISSDLVTAFRCMPYPLSENHRTIFNATGMTLLACLKGFLVVMGGERYVRIHRVHAF